MNSNRKTLIMTLMAVLLFAYLAGSALVKRNSTGKLQLYRSSFEKFDTVIDLQIYADKQGDELLQHCYDLCEAYETIFSRTLKTSELYAVNHRTSDTVSVSQELADVISTGLEYYELSGHRFDITIAPLSDIWDFKSADPALPEETSVRHALERVDASKVTLSGTTLIFSSPDTMIDLGALVKGYAADQLKAYLEENGITSGMLNLGGNVLTIGNKPDGSPWNIGITRPFDREHPVMDSVKVTDQSVVTSGIYERYFEMDGVLYHHVLDPQTGYPVQNDLLSVTIICDSSQMADALSTTCLTLGHNAGKELISSLDGVEAEFILKDQTLDSTFI